jgi:hypothetical protein
VTVLITIVSAKNRGDQSQRSAAAGLLWARCIIWCPWPESNQHALAGNRF